MKGTTNANVIAVCITIIVCFTIAAAVLVFRVAPEGKNTPSLIAVLVATIPGNIVGLTALIKANQIHSNTEKILNGVMESKVRDAMSEVVDEKVLPALPSQYDQHSTPQHRAT